MAWPGDRRAPPRRARTARRARRRPGGGIRASSPAAPGRRASKAEFTPRAALTEEEQSPHSCSASRSRSIRPARSQGRARRRTPSSTEPDEHRDERRRTQPIARVRRERRGCRRRPGIVKRLATSSPWRFTTSAATRTGEILASSAPTARARPTDHPHAVRAR